MQIRLLEVAGIANGHTPGNGVDQPAELHQGNQLRKWASDRKGQMGFLSYEKQFI